MAHAQRRGSVIQGKTATNRRQAPTTRAVKGNVTEPPVYLVKRAGGTNARQAADCEPNEAGETVFPRRAVRPGVSARPRVARPPRCTGGGPLPGRESGTERREYGEEHPTTERGVAKR